MNLILCKETASEVKIKEIVLKLEESNHRAEEAERFLRGQLDAFTNDSYAEYSALKEEFEASQTKLRREKDTSRSLQDKNNELQMSYTATINHMKLSAQEKEAELRQEIHRLKEENQAIIESLQEEVQSARSELRGERSAHSQIVIAERSAAEKNLLSAIETVKMQAVEMERDIKNLHKEEIAAKNIEISTLQQLIEGGKNDRKLDVCTSKRDILFNALVEEVSLLKVAIVEHLKGNKITKDRENVYIDETGDTEIDEIPVEEREPQDGMIAGVISVTIDESESHIIYSSDENAELCNKLLATLQKAIIVLEHDPLDDPDGPHMQQSEELAKTREELAKMKEQSISQKMELDSTLSVLSAVREQSNQLEQTLQTFNERTLNELRSENSELRSLLDTKDEEIASGQQEFAHLSNMMNEKQEELQATKSSFVDAQTKLSSLQARMKQVVDEYEDEGKRLRDLVQVCKDETAREVAARFDVIEAEKVRLEKIWSQSLALEREVYEDFILLKLLKIDISFTLMIIYQI